MQLLLYTMGPIWVMIKADLSWSGRRFHPLARQRRTFIGDLVND